MPPTQRSEASHGTQGRRTRAIAHVGLDLRPLVGNKEASSGVPSVSSSQATPTRSRHPVPAIKTAEHTLKTPPAGSTDGLSRRPPNRRRRGDLTPAPIRTLGAPMTPDSNDRLSKKRAYDIVPDLDSASTPSHVRTLPSHGSSPGTGSVLSTRSGVGARLEPVTQSVTVWQPPHKRGSTMDLALTPESFVAPSRYPRSRRALRNTTASDLWTPTTPQEERALVTHHRPTLRSSVPPQSVVLRQHEAGIPTSRRAKRIQAARAFDERGDHMGPYEAAAQPKIKSEPGLAASEENRNTADSSSAEQHVLTSSGHAAVTADAPRETTSEPPPVASGPEEAAADGVMASIPATEDTQTRSRSEEPAPPENAMGSKSVCVSSKSARDPSKTDLPEPMASGMSSEGESAIGGEGPSPSPATTMEQKQRHLARRLEMALEELPQLLRL
ncbi:hypothetical protein CXG81DRAFT_20114 [Caulochytrium protostelioides]|uniref:Uncharacterized protein n=1 Tax=Caulochytrium protostelioides TaxID=1555241 RepID=A0A4P9X454_9FUNG|nr:hypothetical protein CXG81DRAFT_20114 [Caulochytrium protostelioides]|eukprot:RKO99845.1 hypothetical protein CXG81DRAFT_20114 [Caulochytrium protostelioides]